LLSLPPLHPSQGDGEPIGVRDVSSGKSNDPEQGEAVLAAENKRSIEPMTTFNQKYDPKDVIVIGVLIVLLVACIVGMKYC